MLEIILWENCPLISISGKAGTALLLVVLKLYAWMATDASSMLASATDSMLDLFASLMNVVIIHYALDPADNNHKFGHGKAESLAGLVQAAFVTGRASSRVRQTRLRSASSCAWFPARQS